MIECLVILDPKEANDFLVEHGEPPFRVVPADESVELLERNDYNVAILAQHKDGAANVLLCAYLQPPEQPGSKPGLRTLCVSLAMLENVCEAMRAAVGPDGRLTDEPG